MSDMPHPRPPYLQRETTRYDKTVWYVRRQRHGLRIRLKADYGTEKFWQEYQAALSGLSPQPTKVAAGTLEWLVEQYREVPAWTDLSLATRKQRENILRSILEKAGTQPASKITRAHIVEGRDRRKKSQGRHFIDTMRGLFEWAADAQHVKIDPTAGVKYPKQPKTGGHIPWTEEDIAAYERRWPIGTRQRVWLDVLVYTGLRRGDVVTLGRQHVRDGAIYIKTEKTNTQVALPILMLLSQTLAAGPCGDLTFIVGAKGRAMTKESFGNEFRDACRAAGLHGRGAHGLRKAAATRAALSGATVPQLNAIFGWTGVKMAMHYIETADRIRLAADAMHKLEREVNKSAPYSGGSKGQTG
jgi:integrase